MSSSAGGAAADGAAVYQPFYVWISGTAEAPQAAVDHAPGGGLPQTPLDLSLRAAVLDLLHQVQAGANDPGTVAALGRGLFAMLFTAPFRDLYQRSLGRLSAGQRLRLLLRIDVPELAALPWEMLCNPADNSFLVLDPQLSLARYLPQAARPSPPPRSGPLRVLAVCASPRDLPALDLARELGLIAAALREGPDTAGITLDVLMDPATAAATGLGLTPHGPPTPAALVEALNTGYDVFHYAGHGTLDANGMGVLALEDERRQTARFDADTLRLAVQGSPLRLAVLSACKTAATTPAAAGGAPAAGAAPNRDILLDVDTLPAPAALALPVAPALVRAGLGAVVAMQFVIPDDSAILFSRALYRAVRRNAPIDDCVSQARKALGLGRSPRADWAIPVLFLQEVGDGRLWDTPAAAAPVPAVAGGSAGEAAEPVRAGGIEFLGQTTITGAVVSGDVQNLTLGDFTTTIGGPAAPPATAAAVLPPTSPVPAGGALGAAPLASGPVPAGTAPVLAEQLRPAFRALVTVADDSLLPRLQALRTALLAPAPDLAQISALRQELAAQPGLAGAVAAFFHDPTVQQIVDEAKLRALGF